MGSRQGRSQGSHPARLLLGPVRWALVLLLAALFAVLLAVAPACGPSSSDAVSGGTAPTPKQGGTYNYPLGMDPGSFDLVLEQTSETWAVLHQVYEGLVRWEEQTDGTMKTAPCLAESWSGNADATVWTFKLRHGVMFQAPVSREVIAEDVVADLRYLIDPAHAGSASYMYATIEGTNDDGLAGSGALGVEAVDRYTVRFTLKRPFSEFPDTLGNLAFWVWPADHLREVGRKAYGAHPVGTGPYRFLKRVPGTSVDLVRNPGWWDTSGGPYIDAIHFQVFDSVTSMMLAFQKGVVDWTLLPVGQVPASQSLPQVKSRLWQVVTTPSLALRYLCFNWNDPLVGGTQGLRLRQALAYGCDRRAISDASSGGVFLPATTGVVPPGVPGSHNVQEPYPYDPAKAKELIDGIGPVTLRLTYTIGQQQQATVRILTASFAKMGITIKAKGIDFNHHVRYVYAGKAQAYLGGWLADYPSMDNFLYFLFESGQSPYSDGISYSNPEVDALIAQARATPGEEARLEHYAEAERLILADSPAIPLIVFADARLLNSRAVNVRFNSMGWVDLWRAWMK